MVGEIVLLGDSIFDNAAYTAGQPDVVRHLQLLLPGGWRASLRAVDGARVSGLQSQLAGVPGSATHLIVAVGGNDALANMDLLSSPVRSTAAAWDLFGERVGAFESDYRAAVAHALKLERKLTLCTIYNGNLEPSLAPRARLALTLFNDVILRTACERSIDVIELRLVCTDPADYANPIEPSGAGGLKIARSILAAVGIDAGGSSVSRVVSLRRTAKH